jgi:hypothetical protein
MDWSLWPDFVELLQDSLADRRRVLLRLVARCRAGVNRSIRSGEGLSAAWAGNRLGGCGGRTVDPELAAPDIGPVRRLYPQVLPSVVEHRREQRPSDAAMPQTAMDMMTAHALDPGAARFYEHFGFERCPGCGSRTCNG